MKISKKITTDKRSNTVISVKVQKTKISLIIDDMTLKLSRVKAERIHRTLGKALMIQDTNRKNIA